VHDRQPADLVVLDAEPQHLQQDRHLAHDRAVGRVPPGFLLGTDDLFLLPLHNVLGDGRPRNLTRPRAAEEPIQLLEPPPGFLDITAPRRLVARHEVGAQLVVGHSRGLGDQGRLKCDAGLMLLEHALRHVLVGGLRRHANALAVLIELNPPHRTALVEMPHVLLPYSVLLRAYIAAIISGTPPAAPVPSAA
jgi:hypothetical protein